MRKLTFVASTAGPVKADVGLTVLPTHTTREAPAPDLIVVPGSGRPLAVLKDAELIGWLRDSAPNCRWTASVCTGAGLYAKAGLLEDRPSTTHWAFRDNLAAMGVDVRTERVVWAGTHVSGAGVSAGIDMALSLTDRVYGRELAEGLQLGIEYDPQPPFASGSPDTASANSLRIAMRMLLGDRPLRTAAAYGRHMLASRLGR